MRAIPRAATGPVVCWKRTGPVHPWAGVLRRAAILAYHAAHERTGTDQPPVDLAPLAQVIERQNQRNEVQAQRIAELSAALGMWQARAYHLEEQLAQLTAGDSDPVPADVPPDTAAEPEPENTPSEPPSPWPRVRPWLSGMGGA